MRINIAKKYIANVQSKYPDYTKRTEYEKAYTKKERSMWFFALLMLKKEDVYVYDSDNPKDVEWLQENLDIAVHIEGVEKFTLEEWFKFLSTQPDE